MKVGHQINFLGCFWKMDSGDHADHQLTASDTRFGGTRNHSFSNLFQGFFGVKPTPASVRDIPSSGTTKESEESSNMHVVSPSNDDSWILSQLLLRKHESKDDSDLRRNVTWSEFRKLENRLSRNSSAASSTADLSERTDNKPQSCVNIPLAETSGSDAVSLAVDRVEEFEKPKGFVGKVLEQSHHSNAILWPFLAHDVSRDALKARTDEHSMERTGEMECHKSGNSLPAALDSSPRSDLVDHSCLPTVVISSEKNQETKHTLRDVLWNFNHEKINVSRKEMNLIASIDP